MRLFAATLATETNSFSPLPTGIDNFKEGAFLRPGEHPEQAPLWCTEPLWVARRRATADGFTLVEGSCFYAEPSAPTNQRDYEFMRDEILSQIKEALPLDGILLGLHGAMVAYGYDDVEGDLLERVRDLVGHECVIGVELDPHCHLTIKRVKLADIIILYKEYPHTDQVERAEELLDLVLKTIRGEVNPVMSLYDCRQLAWYRTDMPPMRDLVDRIKAIEGKEGVLSISIGHCFPLSDVPEVGSRVLVIMDKDKAKGDTLATELGMELVSMRGQRTWFDQCPVEDGINAALECHDAPVVIADCNDNAGGGAASDNTTVLRCLIERKVESAALGPLWDPMAVRLCFQAGEGAKLPLRIGGKIGPDSGVPIDATVSVVGLQQDCWQSSGPTQNPLGDCAAVRIGGIEVVLCSERTQALGLELFTNVGVDPLIKKILVLKSVVAFLASYGPFAKKVIFVKSDGLLGKDFTEIPYKAINRPIWPLDEEAKPYLLL
ncbi:MULTISPECIES: M81 family metallopeptidase [Sinorhizobium]|uniref:M81 family metallopeptidase n=1 Tax=Sinorhizobium TaxID=28105 RepID=UPI000487D3DB|nr:MULTISPECIES: M81 family metallopeptidase [Sinorhizobium]WOS66884.1 M81 family metallopeptidase [Sinorhizobium fredii GR64]